MTQRQRAAKHLRRRAHALRQDNRRPKGSELLSDIRKRSRAERRAT